MAKQRAYYITYVSLLLTFTDQFHVTVPHQPCAQFSEAVLKTSLATKIDVICPSTSNSVLEIPLDHVRRFGYELMYDIDMVWFEICTCKSKQQGGEFHFCIVASGISAAHLIVVETKRKIEACTRAHLIQEQSTDVQLSFISRAHYGCIPFPPQVRTAIVQTSLTSLQSSWGRTSRQGARKMSAMGSSSWSFSPGSLECNQDRRSTVQSLLTTRPTTPQPSSPRHSPSPSPGPSPAHSPSPSSSKTTLNELRRGSHPSTTSKGSSSRSDTSDSGVPLDEFDSSRSAPPHSSPYKKTTLDGLRRANKSFDYGKGSPPVRKKTLGDLKSARVDSGTFFPSKDSVLEGSGELIVQGKPGYDHLDAPQGCGSLLPPSQQPAVPPRSLASLGSDYIRT